MTELHDALEACMNAMERGASLDAVLKRYPRHAEELRPLLEASLLARGASRIHVPLDVRQRGRARLMQHAQAAVEARTIARRRSMALFPRLALTAALLVALVLTSTGLVSAASTSLPGQQLYPVKRTWESVRLLLAFTPQERDLMESHYDQERLDEISEMLGKQIAAPITFSGLVSRQLNGQWTVSGIPVLVTPATVLPAVPIPDGAPVSVSGTTRPDGVVQAQRIELLPAGASLPPFEPSEGNEHESDHEGGELGTPAPTVQPLPTTPGPGPQADHHSYEFTGVVQSMQGNVWKINGQVVYVEGAHIVDPVSVGSLVKFEGYYGADGRFIVTKIESEHSGSDSKKSAAGSPSGSGDSESSDGGGDSSGGEAP